jgi:hypothetical protein
MTQEWVTLVKQAVNACCPTRPRFTDGGDPVVPPAPHAVGAQDIAFVTGVGGEATGVLLGNAAWCTRGLGVALGGGGGLGWLFQMDVGAGRDPLSLQHECSPIADVLRMCVLCGVVFLCCDRPVLVRGCANALARSSLLIDMD